MDRNERNRDGSAKLLRPRDVAELLGVSTRTVQRLLRRGVLVEVRIGRATRVKADSVQAFVDAGGAR